MKDLHLNLIKKWYNLVHKDEKKEEYREMSPYWAKRLLYEKTKGELEYRQFDNIIFSNGYKTDRPQFKIKCLGIRIGTGKLKWGAEKGKKYFVLKLGELVND